MSPVQKDVFVKQTEAETSEFGRTQRAGVRVRINQIRTDVSHRFGA